MERVTPYGKFIVAVIGSGVTAALGLIGPGTDLFVVLTVTSAMLTAAGVFFTPNVPDGAGTHRAE